MAVSTEDLRARLVELTAERDALRAQLEAGDIPAATRWLQRKVWRQATALDKLNGKVVRQRFVLRTLDQLGRSLTGEEFGAARDRVTNASLRDRFSGPDAACRGVVRGGLPCLPRTTPRRTPQVPDGRAAASKAVISGFDSRLGHAHPERITATPIRRCPWRRPRRATRRRRWRGSLQAEAGTTPGEY
jgi:hypothetical protein